MLSHAPNINFLTMYDIHVYPNININFFPYLQAHSYIIKFKAELLEWIMNFTIKKQ